MAVPLREVHKRRSTITALPLYYSGHLLMKHRKEKIFKRFHGELRGATLFLYKDDTLDTYTEKLDLEELKTMELDSPYEKKAPTIFTLTLKTGEVQLKMDNPDKGEEWRGYILTVIKKQLPSKLQLLPGQMLQLEDVLAQEKRRNMPMPRPPLPPRPPFLSSASTYSSTPPIKDVPDGAPGVPECFFNVSRAEAERMLEANPECGSIILRPSTHAKNYALTLRQLTASGPVKKNYRLTATDSGFIIELDTPVKASSLNDVLKYFLEKTEYRLHPFMSSQPYDTCIDVSPAPVNISLNTPIAKTVPKAQVAPMLRSNTKEERPLPDEPVDGEYINPDDHIPDRHKKKQVHFDGELRDALKLRRDTIDSAADKEEVYQNQTGDKPHTVQWMNKKSMSLPGHCFHLPLPVSLCRLHCDHFTRRTMADLDDHFDLIH
ncbi:signal-transducing adaptor protein 1-like isoform X1 [Sparus aurata]|uniref:Signal-transducing adaptor protein 1-like n=1 Tax=Sparus aurata TaxID=8175 RepID=A0A671VPS7_SPAAU|nr:signal-transducing adaptor protein 1-like isoform X1 [Sparus aurata]